MNNIISLFKETNIFNAIEKNNIKYVVKNYDKCKHDIETRNEKKNTPLIYVCRLNKIKMLKRLIEKGIDLDTTLGNDPITAIYVAAQDGLFEILKLLFENGADPNIIDRFTLLHAASLTANIEIAQFLLENGADINALDSNKCFTPLHIGAHFGNVKYVKFLLRNGAKISSYENDARHSPLVSASQSSNLDVMKFFINDNVTDVEYASMLYLAGFEGNVDVIHFLLDYNVNLDLKHEENSGYTALIAASQEGKYDTVKLLLENGADPNICSIKGYAPLHIASQYNHIKIVRLLIEYKADPHIANIYGHSPASNAVSNTYDAVIKVILAEYTAKIEARKQRYNIYNNFQIFKDTMKTVDILTDYVGEKHIAILICDMKVQLENN